MKRSKQALMAVVTAVVLGTLMTPCFAGGHGGRSGGGNVGGGHGGGHGGNANSGSSRLGNGNHGGISTAKGPKSPIITNAVKLGGATNNSNLTRRIGTPLPTNAARTPLKNVSNGAGGLVPGKATGGVGSSNLTKIVGGKLAGGIEHSKPVIPCFPPKPSSPGGCFPTSGGCFPPSHGGHFSAFFNCWNPLTWYDPCWDPCTPVVVALPPYTGGSTYPPVVVAEQPVIVEVATTPVVVPVSAETVTAEPMSSEVAPTPEAPPAAPLASVRVGGTITLQEKNLGDKQGEVFLQLDQVALPVMVREWAGDHVTATLPTFGLVGPSKAQLFLVRADGQVANAVPVEVLPALPPTTSAQPEMQAAAGP